MDRKDFFKTIANSIGEKVADKLDEVQKIVDDEPQLVEEQKQFLQTYTLWLAEFQVFVKKRNGNPFDIENNKRLMKLSADADGRKEQLENHMTDPIFSKHFNQITKELSELIS